MSTIMSGITKHRRHDEPLRQPFVFLPDTVKNISPVNNVVWSILLTVE